MKKSKGFTLIELLVVIGIIGLLAAMIGISTVSARQKGRDSRRLADAQSIKSALEMYYEENGRFPKSTNSSWNSSFDESDIGGRTWAGPTLARWIEDTSTTPILFTPTYIQAAPGDPINDASHRYYYKSDAVDYKIISLGLEGERGKNYAKNDNGCRKGPPDCSWGISGNDEYEIFTPGAQLW